MAETIKLGNGNWGVKPNSTLAYNDENNIFKPIELTSSRASTKTRTNEQGLIEDVDSNVMAIDFADSVNGALKLEQQSTNLVTHSEDFSSGGWAKTRATITSNSTISPKGDLTADLLIGDTTNGQHNVRITTSNSVTATLSLYVKAKELSFIQIACVNTTQQYVNFDCSNGTLGNIGSAFDVKVKSLSNGWYRLEATTLNNAYNSFYISLVSSLTATWLESWAMPNNTDGLYIWGAQLEEKSYATSYIPTAGTQITRLADAVSKTGLENFINSSEGVLYAEIKPNKNTEYGGVYLSDNTTSNRLFFVGTSTTNEIAVGGNGITTLRHVEPNLSEKYNKIAVLFTSTNTSFFVNGVKVDTNSTNYTGTDFTTLSFNDLDNNPILQAKLKDLKVYNETLTDSELITLTTL